MFRHLLRAVALAAALSPAARGVAAPLSLDQAIDLAVQRSQMTRSALAGAVSAAEMARAAGQQPDPMLSVGVDNLPATGPNRFSTTAEDMTMKRIGITQEWVASDKRAAREASALAMGRRESAMAQSAAADARVQTAMAYIDAFYAGEAVKLTTLNEAHAREELEAGRGRLATPSGNSADVLGLSSALGAAEDDSADVRQQQGTAAAGLQRWTGLAAEELDAPRLSEVPSLEDFVARHPVVVAKARDVDVARHEMEVARLSRTPNWTYEVSYGQRQGRADLVSVGVSIPLPLAPADRQDRETAARLALIEKAEADLAEAQRAAAGDYAALTSDMSRLRERIERVRSGVLAPLAQRSAATLAAYRSNQAGLAALFDARHAEVGAQRKLLGLQRDLARTLAQLIFKPVHPGAAQ